MNEDMRHSQQLIEQFEDCLKHPEKLRTTYFDSEDLNELFRMYLSFGDVNTAEMVAQIAVRLHPDDEDAMLYALNILLEKGQPKKALKWIDEHPLPDTYYAYYLHMWALVDVGDTESANKMATKVLETIEDDSEYSIVLEVIGNCFMRGDMPQEAIIYFDKAIEAAKSSNDIYNLLMKKVDCLAATNQLDKAISMLDKLNDEDPYNINTWQSKTMMLLQAGRTDEALDAIDYALAIAPSNEVNQILKIRMLIGNKKREEVFEYIDSVRQDLPHMQPLLLMLKGDAAFWEHDYKTANQYYKQGFDKEFFMLDSVIRYIECKIELHRYRSAIKIGKFLMLITPDDPQLLCKMADAHYFSGDRETAKKYLKRAVKIDPYNISIYMQLITLLLDMDELEEAKRLTKRALKFEPQQMYLKLLMAIISYIQNDYKHLVKYFTEACQINETAVDLLEQLCPTAAEFISDLIKEYKKINEDE